MRMFRYVQVEIYKRELVLTRWKSVTCNIVFDEAYSFGFFGFDFT